jgi:serine/threonine protein kinase, bacterial
MSECHACGANVNEGELFCGNCGIPLKFSMSAGIVDRGQGIAVSRKESAPGADDSVAVPLSSPAASTPSEPLASSPDAEPENASPAPALSESEFAQTITPETESGSSVEPDRAADSATATPLPEPAAFETIAYEPQVNQPEPQMNAVTDLESVVAPSLSDSAKVEAPDPSVAAEQPHAVAPPGLVAKAEPIAEMQLESSAPQPPEVDAVGQAEVAAKAEPVTEMHIEAPVSTGELASAHMGETSSPNRGTTGGHRPAVKQLQQGTVLNSRYEIVRRIGGGGMGAVYLAKDRNLGDAPRAVKEMVESHLDSAQHEKAIGDFKRESLLLTSLEHPSIPTIYDYFYDDKYSRFYLVMKYIAGGDLASRLRSAPAGRLDEKLVSDWGMQIADVLHYLHTRPKAIIYRDLKPANLMIDGNTSRIMLIDFGIARWVTKQEKGVTAVGTMGYAPPELFSGRVEARSDVYSLGATMFHLLTGADPQDNPLLIFDFNKNPRPRQLAPSLSTEMEQILMRAVEYKPEDRFRSAGELRDVLATHLEKLMAGRVSYGIPAPLLGGETVQVQSVFCGFCGGRIAADDVFCAHCGARQPQAGVGTGAVLLAARPTAKLVVTGTAELDASFILQKDSNLVGRTDPHSNIFPEIDLSRFDPETKVSRRHARIWREGETFLVEDLGSVNGTVINDSVRLAPRQPRVLDSGDKLRLGETTLHFLVG